MKILIIDNYDSFTYNLVHYFEALGAEVHVARNDSIGIEEVAAFDAVVLSPGPGLPEDAGICVEVIKTYYKTKKILGVCLGHQAIAVAFGGCLKNLDTVMHGVQRDTFVCQPGDYIFRGLPEVLACGRYHSWVVDEAHLPALLEVTARDAEGHIMALRHREYDVRGLQFHPESVMTPEGRVLLRNWMGNE